MMTSDADPGAALRLSVEPGEGEETVVRKRGKGRKKRIRELVEEGLTL